MTTTELTPAAAAPAVHNPRRLDVTHPATYQHLQAVARELAKSQIVPPAYRLKPANCMIALQMAARIGCDAITVMQNLHVIQGRPTFGSSFLIAVWNSCGRFTPIRFRWLHDEQGVPNGCRAWSKDLATGETLESIPVTIALAEAEGWSTKNGSKWKTMPQQMMMYRSAAFLVRACAPEIALGLHTVEEVRDIEPDVATVLNGHELQDVATATELEIPPDEVVDAQAGQPVPEQLEPDAAVDVPFEGDIYATIRSQRKQLGISDDRWRSILGKRGVAKTTELTAEQAEEIRRNLWSKLTQREAGN